MFGSSVLEIAIGLMFIYLLLSLACTALNEAIASVLNKRGAFLFEGVKNLLNDPAFTGLAQQIYNHGLVDSLSREASSTRARNRLPAYLSATTFSLALLDVLSARGAIDASCGDLLSAAERADDAFDQTRAAAESNPQRADDLAKATVSRDAARAALEAAATQARAAARQAARDPGAQPQNSNATQDVPQANDKAEAAEAAVKILDARRAAIACARDPKNADLVRVAANTLERALAAGRTIAEKCPDPMANLHHAVERLPDGHTKESLLVLMSKTRREATALDRLAVDFQRNVEDWFNGAMAHVSGWYKRWTQAVVAALALVVVCAANADTVQIVQRLSRDGPLRAALVAAADDAARNPQGSNDAGVRAVLEQAEDLTLPLGWTRATATAATTPLGLLSKVIGLIASVLAVSLGAPFWFDTLSKVINLRGAGTPPDQSQRSAPGTR